MGPESFHFKYLMLLFHNLSNSTIENRKFAFFSSVVSRKREAIYQTNIEISMHDLWCQNSRTSQGGDPGRWAKCHYLMGLSVFLSWEGNDVISQQEAKWDKYVVQQTYSAHPSKAHRNITCSDPLWMGPASSGLLGSDAQFQCLHGGGVGGWEALLPHHQAMLRTRAGCPTIQLNAILATLFQR